MARVRGMPDDTPRQRIQSAIDSDDVVLFMKGSPEAPQCGFSATVVRILEGLVPRFHHVDVLADPGVREGIKEFSSWPTIPQLYVRGQFVGGCDIVQETFASGELHAVLGVELPDAEPPAIRVTDAAARALREATAGAPPEQRLHLRVSARWQSGLSLEPRAPGELEVESNGIALLVDPLTAQRARDATIDVLETPRGTAFQVALPHAPTPEAAPTAGGVRQMSVAELRRRLDAGDRFELLDVRTPEERAIASLPRARLLHEQEAGRLSALPKDTVLVFHCHHGGRSQQAAEHFAALGFTDVWNVEGGIDAWSREIDPEVPRY